jgi:signal transduction histidine kinase
VTDQFPCSPDELRTLFLFEKLTEEQLDWVCRNGYVELLEPGFAYREGDPATCFYVLLEGEVATSRQVGGDEIEFSRTTQRGVYGGAFQAYLGDRVPQTYTNSMRLIVPSRLYVLDADKFAQMMRDWFPMAVHLLEGLFFGTRSAQLAIGQRERLLALGSLSAGLTHELNNPASSAVRATSLLRERVAGMRHKLALITSGRYDRVTLETLMRLQEAAVEHVAKKAASLTPLEAADREDELGDWFESHGIAGGWDIAPTFVQAGIDLGWLQQLPSIVDGDTLEGAIRWLNYTLETELLMNEIEDSTTRMSTLVTAAKQYSQLDRAPYQVVDIHELLDSTLIMLSRKIGDGVTIVKDYDRSLPDVPVYAAELNQVWTNLIDNAVDAMSRKGTLTVRTSRVGDEAQVEIGDTGPGVPDEIRTRLFEPFFTTKPVGEGTGLGLDISWRIVVNKHHGDLSFESVPGDTRFRVRIPLTPQED